MKARPHSILSPSPALSTWASCQCLLKFPNLKASSFDLLSSSHYCLFTILFTAKFHESLSLSTIFISTPPTSQPPTTFLSSLSLLKLLLTKATQSLPCLIQQSSCCFDLSEAFAAIDQSLILLPLLFSSWCSFISGSGWLTE